MILVRPADAIRGVLLLPAHPLLIPSMVSGPLILSFASLGIPMEAYFVWASLLAIPGWLFVLGTAVFSKHTAAKAGFYGFIAVHSALTVVCYATTIAVNT
jgi:hypothetical protein